MCVRFGCSVEALKQYVAGADERVVQAPPGQVTTADHFNDIRPTRHHRCQSCSSCPLHHRNCLSDCLDQVRLEITHSVLKGVGGHHTNMWKNFRLDATVFELKELAHPHGMFQKTHSVPITFPCPFITLLVSITPKRHPFLEISECAFPP